MRHKWSQPLNGLGIHECTRCRTTMVILHGQSIGAGRCAYLKTYVRPDGIRFTGCAPACVPGMMGRPLLMAYRQWLKKQRNTFGWAAMWEMAACTRGRRI